jgi:pyrimidine operon attenuation protein/uracil phosphoribosyltransferase
LKYKKVIFIDDVLFTGRSIRSALTAIQSFADHQKLNFLVLLTDVLAALIQPDYRGRQVRSIMKK